jgi:hypothetical protein
MSVLLPAAAQINYNIRCILLPVYTVAMTIKMICKCCSILCRCHLNSYSKSVLSDYRNIIEVQNLNVVPSLTLNLPMSTIVAPPSNASKWQMGFNSVFKGLKAMPWLRWLVTRLSL